MCTLDYHARSRLSLPHIRSFLGSETVSSIRTSQQVSAVDLAQSADRAKVSASPRLKLTARTSNLQSVVAKVGVKGVKDVKGVKAAEVDAEAEVAGVEVVELSRAGERGRGSLQVLSRSPGGLYTPRGWPVVRGRGSWRPTSAPIWRHVRRG
ncbi:unnamed protein product [Rhizoctonia solani]|uniref:Uncharacterized protein n=1 Tax=Rhizoctonia solani TaxID=456999 RepID=A0A8H3HWI0_9AGAM|nr:unnamed protein product [Rhizoctonia solani]